MELPKKLNIPLGVSQKALTTKECVDILTAATRDRQFISAAPACKPNGGEYFLVYNGVNPGDKGK